MPGRQKRQTCAGCGKSFGPVRKVRSLYVVGFRGINGQTSTHPAPLCGLCTAFVNGPGARPYDLPGLEKLAQGLEILTLAERTGGLQ